MHPYANVADGQLAATSTTMYTAGVEGGPVNILLSNVGYSEKTVILTVLRNGSTARRVRRIVLLQNEADHIVGLPMSPGDVLAGYDGSGGSIDYTISLSQSPFSVETRDESGFPKQSASVTLTTTEKGATVGELVIAGLLEQIRDVLYEMK